MEFEGAGLTRITSLDPAEAARIEAEVEEIRASVPGWVWDGRTLPVPVDEIVREVYGLRVCHVTQERIKDVLGESSGDGWVSGLLLAGAGEIWVTEDEAANPAWGPQRSRFTTGHELGHFVMHQEAPVSIYCRKTGVEEGFQLDPIPRPVPEVEANTFAASLLMPPDQLWPEIRDGADEDTIIRLTERFRVSDKAMRRRIETLRMIG